MDSDVQKFRKKLQKKYGIPDSFMEEMSKVWKKRPDGSQYCHLSDMFKASKRSDERERKAGRPKPIPHYAEALFTRRAWNQVDPSFPIEGDELYVGRSITGIIEVNKTFFSRRGTSSRGYPLYDLDVSRAKPLRVEVCPWQEPDGTRFDIVCLPGED